MKNGGGEKGKEIEKKFPVISFTMCMYAGKELVKSMSVLTQLRKAANHPLLLRYHYSDDIIASMSTEILKVSLSC